MGSLDDSYEEEHLIPGGKGVSTAYDVPKYLDAGIL
jgi:hypothetical protein